MNFARRSTAWSLHIRLRSPGMTAKRCAGAMERSCRYPAAPIARGSRSSSGTLPSSISFASLIRAVRSKRRRRSMPIRADSATPPSSRRCTATVKRVRCRRALLRLPGCPRLWENHVGAHRSASLSSTTSTSICAPCRRRSTRYRKRSNAPHIQLPVPTIAVLWRTRASQARTATVARSISIPVLGLLVLATARRPHPLS
jgi:hypothetical protein